MKNVTFNRKRGHYEARLGIPEPLRPIIGKPEFRENLGSDKKQAERKAYGFLNSWHMQLDEAREKLDAHKPTLSTAAKAHYRQEVRFDDMERMTGKQNPVAAFTRPIYAAKLRGVANGDIKGEEAENLIGYAVDQLSPDQTPDVPRSQLLKALAEIQFEALKLFAERDEGKITTTEPKHPLLTEPDPAPLTPTNQLTPGTGETLSDILASFHKERTAAGASLAEKTMDEHRTAIRMFEEFIGYAIPVRQITKQDVLGYKNALLDTPTRYTTRFPGLTLPQAIKANKKRPKPFETLNVKTINMKWLSHLSTILKYASRNNKIEANPAAEIRVDTGKAVHSEPTRVPFNQDDLKRMFGTDLFKDPSTYETRQWALLLALFAGSRSSSELARVKLSDVYQEQGIDVVYLEDASKNSRSKRLVPIHQTLIDLGFLDYVANMRKAGKEHLFPDWIENERRDTVNRWFLRTYKAQVGINDSRKVFHSFRHTLKTALARYGTNRDISDLITGHKDQSVSGVYIAEASFTMIGAMADALNKVSFDLPIMALYKHKED